MCKSCPQNIIFVILGVAQIIAGILGLSGLGVNTLLSTKAHGHVDILYNGKDIGTGAKIQCKAIMRLEAFYFDCEITPNTTLVNKTTEKRTYTYNQAYDEMCHNSTGRNTGNSTEITPSTCNLMNKMVTAFDNFRALLATAGAVCIGLGAYLVLVAVGRHFCCHRKDEKDERALVRCFISCGSECITIWLCLVVTILYGFSWGIVFVVQYSNKKELSTILTNAVNNALASQYNRYYLTWGTIIQGGTVEPLAIAGVICFIAFVYMTFSWIFTTCCALCECCCGDEEARRSVIKQQEMVHEEHHEHEHDHDHHDHDHHHGHQQDQELKVSVNIGQGEGEGQMTNT